MKKLLFLFSILVSLSVSGQVVQGIRGEFRDSVTSLTNNTNLVLKGKGTGLVEIEGAYTLPGVDGSAGQAMITDGAGTISFGDVSSVTFGTDNQIPFMNAGGTDFEYSSDLLFDGSTFTLGADLDFSGANHNISNTGDIDFQTGATGGTIRTGTSNADKWQLQAYDVNGAAHQTVASAHAGNEPLFHLFSNSLRFTDATDNTKRASFDLSGITTGTTRDFAVPDADGTLVIDSDIANQVTASSTFGTDNRLLRSDGTGRGSQSSAITVDDSGNMSGVGTLSAGTGGFSGNVGAGITSPSVRLHVYESATNTVGLIESDAANSIARLELRNDAQSWDIRTIGSSSDEFHISDLTNTKVPFKIQPNAPSNSIFIQANGQVGIGTGTPGSTLDVNGSLNAGAGSFSTLNTTSNIISGGDLEVDQAAGNTRDLIYRSSGSTRWVARVDNVAESGSNAGSNYSLQRYSDAGALLGTALSIIRSTGAATFSTSVSTPSLTLSGATANTLAYFNASKQVTSLTNGTGFLFNDGSGNFSYDNTLGDVTKVGTPVDNQIAIWTGDGTLEGDANLIFSNGVLVAGGNRVFGAQTSTTNVSFRGGPFTSDAGVVTYGGSSVSNAGDLQLQMGQTNGVMEFYGNDGSTRVVRAEMDANGTFDHMGNSITNADLLGLTERSSDPGDPSEGQSSIWQSDGTGAGDDGDIMIKVTAGGVTKTITLVDFSAF